MKFLWNNPQEVFEKPLGYKPVGLTRKGKRPDMCLFSISETHEIFESRWEYFAKCLSHILKKETNAL